MKNATANKYELNTTKPKNAHNRRNGIFEVNNNTPNLNHCLSLNTNSQSLTQYPLMAIFCSSSHAQLVNLRALLRPMTNTKKKDTKIVHSNNATAAIELNKTHSQEKRE